MILFDDPTHMTPDDRFRDVAAILATGVLRLRPNAASNAAETTNQNPLQPLPNGLDLVPDTRLSGHDVLTATRV